MLRTLSHENSRFWSKPAQWLSVPPTATAGRNHECVTRSVGAPHEDASYEGNVRLSFYRVKPLDARLVTDTGADFDELSYSRFKHGDGALAERYGRELTARLWGAAPEFAEDGEPIVIASAPYRWLPTALHELAFEVRRALSSMLAGSGRRPVEIGSLRMSRADHSNYARLYTALSCPRRPRSSLT